MAARTSFFLFVCLCGSGCTRVCCLRLLCCCCCFIFLCGVFFFSISYFPFFFAFVCLFLLCLLSLYTLYPLYMSSVGDASATQLHLTSSVFASVFAGDRVILPPLLCHRQQRRPVCVTAVTTPGAIPLKKPRQQHRYEPYKCSDRIEK